MATTEQAPAAVENGRRHTQRHPRREPGDGRDRSRPSRRSAPTRSTAMVERARAAQPAWEALGFEERGAGPPAHAEVDGRQRRPDHPARSSRRPARPTRTRCSPRSCTARTRSASGPRRRPSTSPTSTSSRPTRCEGQEADRALRAGRRRRRDRPVELPAHELLRRLHPGARRRQRGGPQAGAGDAADLAADGGGPARLRHARARLPGRDRHRPRGRRGADRRGRLRHVHRLDGDRHQGHAARRADAHAGRPRARRQGPDDRARRRRRRARRERRRLLLDEQRRPGLHLGRARLRRGADLRRASSRKVADNVRALRQGVPTGPGTVDIGVDDLPAADRHRRRARQRRRREGRESARRRQARRPARAPSTSRPCSSTSTTRWRA